MAVFLVVTAEVAGVAMARTVILVLVMVRRYVRRQVLESHHIATRYNICDLLIQNSKMDIQVQWILWCFSSSLVT